MTTLLLKLAGPMQSWGDSSRFTVRATRREPTKSGVLGLLAAAQGRRRTDSVEDLLKIRMAVRSDQPGTLVRDFHTAHNEKGEAMPLTERFYLADAVFVVALEASNELVSTLHDALLAPKFPLYLGRRACPPSSPLVLGVSPQDAVGALEPERTPWQAATWFQKTHSKSDYYADIMFDLDSENTVDSGVVVESLKDVPLSFNQENRQYGWRRVGRKSVLLHTHEDVTTHDPMAMLEA